MTNIKLIIIAGCGALGSRIAIDIARPEIDMILIDYDRVKEENIVTSAYTQQHIGMMKTSALGAMLYHKSKVESFEYRKTFNFDVRNIHWSKMMSQLSINPILDQSQVLFIDAFDNIQARFFTTIWNKSNTLHASVGLHNLGAIEWNEVYKLPTSDPDKDICTNMAGRNIIVLTAASAIVSINRFLDTDEKKSEIVRII